MKNRKLTRVDSSAVIEFIRGEIIASTGQIAAKLGISTGRALKLIKSLEYHGDVLRSTNSTKSNFVWKLSTKMWQEPKP